MTDLSAEDAKLVTLARAARARTGADEGAAVRDADGRTYAASSVALASLSLTAVQVCVAMALSSGARDLEAAVLLGEGTEVTETDLATLRAAASSRVTVHRGDARGRILETVRT